MTEYDDDVPDLDRAQIRSAAALGSTDDEIAAYLEVPAYVLQEHYAEDIRIGRLQGRIKLRQLLMDRVENDPKNTKELSLLAQMFFGLDGKR